MSNPTGKGGFADRKHQINRKGRPRSFDALRALAQQIAHETAKTRDGEAIVIDDHVATVTEAILRQWAVSSDHRKQLAFIEYAYGSPPKKTEVSGPEGGPVEVIVKGYVSISPDDWKDDDQA